MLNNKTNREPSSKILAIRNAALASLGASPSTTCPTCARAAGTPFRTYDDRGKVVHGCIDAFHTGHLVTPSESARWQYRPEAVEIRRNELRSISR